MQITLAAARENAHLLQPAAAKQLGISATTLSRWERGLAFPDARAIARIENLYGIPYQNINFLIEADK